MVGFYLGTVDFEIRYIWIDCLIEIDLDRVSDSEDVHWISIIRA